MAQTDLALMPSVGVAEVVRPITAIRWPARRRSGSVLRSFLSSTLPRSAISRAVALCPAVEASGTATAGSGRSNRPLRM
jgi:hypothetical protein